MPFNYFNALSGDSEARYERKLTLASMTWLVAIVVLCCLVLHDTTTFAQLKKNE